MCSNKFYISLSSTDVANHTHTQHKHATFTRPWGLLGLLHLPPPRSIMCSNQEWLKFQLPRNKRSEATPSGPVADHNFAGAPNIPLRAKGSPEPVRTATRAGEDRSEAGLFRDRRHIRIGRPGVAQDSMIREGRYEPGDEICGAEAAPVSASPSWVRTVALLLFSASL